MTLESNVGSTYGARTERELEALWALETSIAGIAAQFKDENAFNYSQEVEIASYLMVSLRETFGAAEQVGSLSVHLSRMEWRCLPGRSIDLVLIQPDSARSAREGWGKGRSKVAKTIPLLAAVQIKRGAGNVTPLSQVRKDLRDLDQIMTSANLGRPVAYFLAWIDSVLRQRPHQTERYLTVKDELRRVTRTPKGILPKPGPGRFRLSQWGVARPTYSTRDDRIHTIHHVVKTAEQKTEEERHGCPPRKTLPAPCGQPRDQRHRGWFNVHHALRLSN